MGMFDRSANILTPSMPNKWAGFGVGYWAGSKKGLIKKPTHMELMFLKLSMMATPKWPTMHLMYVHKKIEIKSQIFRIY